MRQRHQSHALSRQALGAVACLMLCLAAGTLAAADSSSNLAVAAAARRVGDFRIVNNTRCSGHYKLVPLETPQAPTSGRRSCERICRNDFKCASYSLEADSQTSCFLFSNDASCSKGTGWLTGHKDTRCAQGTENSQLVLTCPEGERISAIKFADFGNPEGVCGAYRQSTCHSETAAAIVEDLCVGEHSCTLSATSHVFGDPCRGLPKNLRVQAECQPGKEFNEDLYFNAWSSRNWPAAEGQVAARREEWKDYLDALPAYPDDGSFSGRGILIVAGGKYLRPALVLISLLRSIGCTLRIQVWHLGKEEMTEEHKRMLAPYNVETRDFEDYVDKELLQPIPANVGMRLFQLKPLAILHSDLEDVLLLDSDNCPIHDPSYLFNAPEFLSVGTIFWPDYWKTSLDNPIWSIIGREPEDTWEQESGQLMINKRKAWKALNLCVHFNNEYYMKLLNGDKDTFRFAWLAAGVPFFMMPTSPQSVGTLKELHSSDTGFCGHTMIQHGFGGEPVFVHHNQLKTTHLPMGENFRYLKLAPTDRPWKAVPVPGVRLSDSVLLSCISIESSRLRNVDEDDCPVVESGLGEFERRYFAAQASTEAAVNALSGTLGGFSTSGDSQQVTVSEGQLLDDQVVGSPAAVALARSRRNTTSPASGGPCASNEFELATGVCELITTCSSGETQDASATLTTDTECETTGGWPLEVIDVRMDTASSSARFQLRTSTGNYVTRPTVTLKRTGTYQFTMNQVTEPFSIVTSSAGGAGSTEVTSGLSEKGGVQNNEMLLYTPPLSQASPVYYQSLATSNVGSSISLQDPTWSKMWVGIPVRGSYAGPFQRFSTAYNENVRVFTMTSGLSAQEFVDLRSPCQDRCLTTSMCRGIFIMRLPTRSVCYGLSDLGDSPATTQVESQSWGVETGVSLN